MKHTKEDSKEEKHSEVKNEQEMHPEDSNENESAQDSFLENKKLFIIIAVILGIIIALFGLKYILTPDNTALFPTYDYNGYTFEQYGGLWNTQWQRGSDLFAVHLRYGPRESEDVNVIEGPDANFNPQGKLYLTHDPAETGLGHVALASAELSFTLSRVFNVTPIAACTTNTTSACHGRPIVNCETGGDGAIIYLKEIDDPSQTAVFLNGNCMQIQGTKEELIRAADKVIWIWYGIIQ